MRSVAPRLPRSLPERHLNSQCASGWQIRLSGAALHLSAAVSRSSGINSRFGGIDPHSGGDEDLLGGSRRRLGGSIRLSGHTGRRRLVTQPFRGFNNPLAGMSHRFRLGDQYGAHRKPGGASPNSWLCTKSDDRYKTASYSHRGLSPVLRLGELEEAVKTASHSHRRFSAVIKTGTRIPKPFETVSGARRTHHTGLKARCE